MEEKKKDMDVKFDKEIGCMVKTDEVTVVAKTCDEAIKTIEKLKKIEGE